MYIELTWFIPEVGEFFLLYFGFRKKTGPMYMGHYHIFFYSKANSPYFPGVGVSMDRCISVFTARFRFRIRFYYTEGDQRNA